MKLVKVDFNKYACKVCGYNIETKSIAVCHDGYSCILEFDVSDEEGILEIMNMPVLTIREKLELLTTRFICKNKSEDIMKSSDKNWYR